MFTKRETWCGYITSTTPILIKTTKLELIGNLITSLCLSQMKRDLGVIRDLMVLTIFGSRPILMNATREKTVSKSTSHVEPASYSVLMKKLHIIWKKTQNVFHECHSQLRDRSNSCRILGASKLGHLM